MSNSCTFLQQSLKIQCNCVVDFNKGKLSIYWKAENVAEVASTPLHFWGDTNCTLVCRSAGNCKYSSTSSANPRLLYKVSGPNLVAHLNWTPIIEWHVVRCGSKNIHQKDVTCFEQTGLFAQNLLTILCSIVNIIKGGLYDLNKKENLHSDDEYYSHISSKNYEGNGSGLDLDLLMISH